MNIEIRIAPSERHADGLARISVVVPELETNYALDLPFKELSQRVGVNDPVALDFLIVAALCYVIDKIVPRSTAADNWTREFEVEFPVSTLQTWNLAAQNLDAALKFLTGDLWGTSFRSLKEDYFLKPTSRNRRKSTVSPIQANNVCLLSGGLDSLVGAIDLLTNTSGDRTLLVGHYDAAGPASQQQKLFAQMNAVFPGRAELLQTRVSHKPEAAQEPSLRSRSLVFMALAVYSARTLGDSVPVYAPENGLIAINIPLTPSRTGSCSTRTMHPYFLTKLRDVLNDLGFKNQIINPLALKTKGECIVDCANQSLLKATIGLSVSCSHGTRKQNWVRRTATNCGYCVPCLVRRAALHVAGLDNGQDYGIDVCVEELPADSDSGNDLRAIRDFVGQEKSIQELAFEIRAVAPVEDAVEYATMAARGFDELRALLRS